jgi:hypothetical protein
MTTFSKEDVLVSPELWKNKNFVKGKSPSFPEVLCWLLVCWLLMCWYWPMIVHNINVALSATSRLMRKQKKLQPRSRKYLKIMHVDASTQITQPFAEAENKTLLLFVNIKQEKYDSSSNFVKSPKNV